MRRTLLVCLVLLVACLLQACAGGMDRIKFSKSLKEKDIDQFKAEITRIQTDPGYSPQSRADGLYTALIMAARRDMEATQFLLDQGVPIDYPFDDSTSKNRGYVLSAAIEGYQPDIVKLLLDRGGDPNIELWSIDPRNNLLYISFMHSDLVISRILLEEGANPNQWKNPFYDSLLEFYDGYPDIQSLLEEFGGVRTPTPEQRAGNAGVKATPEDSAKPMPAGDETKNLSVQERLEEIDSLKEQEIISEEEYLEARAKILGDL